MNRIGILGGTFDPIHLGHLRMAEVVLEKMNLAQVIFVPVNLPPHKSSLGLSPAVVRLQMVKEAIRGNPFFKVSSFEIEKSGKSYSIDTVRHFAQNFPNTKFFFIIGYDALTNLHRWKSIDEILKLAGFVVVNRPGDFTNTHRIKYDSVMMPGMDISSTYIRRLVQQEKSIRYLVSDEVRKYIEGNSLYQ